MARSLKPEGKYRYEQAMRQSAFEPFPHSTLREAQEVLAELQRPCGRFKNPLSWEEKLRLRAEQAMDFLKEGERPLLVVGSGVPANWQALVDYLYKQGITGSPRFSFTGAFFDGPKVPSASLAPKEHIIGESDGRKVLRKGFGSASSIEESMSRAVGELLERYFLARYKSSALTRASYQELVGQGERALNISELNDFLSWQKERFPRFERSDTQPLFWVKGRELSGEQEIYLPAQLAFWSYLFPPKSGEPILAQSTTSGCGGHFTKEEAILAALLEAIQRDGFLIYWLNSLSPSLIDPLTFVDKDQEMKDFLAYLQRYGFEYYFLNTTTDVGVPTCTCVLINRGGNEPVITVGAASGFSRRELLFQSAGEALIINSYVMARGPHVLSKRYAPFTNTALGRDQRLRAWRGDKMYERFKFLISGEMQTFESFAGDALWITSPHARLSYVLERLKALGKGYDVYYYEAHDKVLETLGYHAVRVIVPRLMNLYLTENMPTLAAPRLKSVPEKLGYAPAQTFNPWPHPFP